MRPPSSLMRHGKPSVPLHHIVLDHPHDFACWRDHARNMAAGGVPPENINWSVQSSGTQDLFASSLTATPPPAPLYDVRVNKAYLRLAKSVILHRNEARFALLYRLLWRLQAAPHLMEQTADRDVHQLRIMEGHIRRDIHKMRAFVRFRVVKDADDVDRYVAWFEPDHYIARANANFFLNRFASQSWSILTPDICLHWDGGQLRETAGADRNDAPQEDATEELWQRYYASIFNPARLKVSMMVKEMPRRYWKNLPEARLIPQLIAGAQAQEAAMVSQGKSAFPQNMPTTLDEIAQGIAACRGCAIGCNGTRAVAGEGPANARLLIIGEQPGDTEEQLGRPFVGPAGRLLDMHLHSAGFDRSSIRVTNAVKHFKYELRGKRRIHQSPTAGEIDHCRWWLDAERNIIKPDVILTLGASASRAILGRTPNIKQERGEPKRLDDGSILWMTMHPSAILRLNDDTRKKEEINFQNDLMKLRSSLSV